MFIKVQVLYLPKAKVNKMYAKSSQNDCKPFRQQRS